MKRNKTWNQHVVKKENKSLVLDTIRASSPISRADIANQTGLNKGTVSSLVSELIEEKFIYESGPGQSSGGRRPVMLIFNKVAGFSIGIDLGVNYILGVLTDLKGNVYAEQFLRCKDLSFETIKSKLFNIIDSLISSAPNSPYGIIGIGVGVPGIINTEGDILLAPNLEWKNIALKKIIEENYSLPVIIENEANAGAYGEKKLGVGKNFEHIIYVSVGIGIGVGMILNNQLFRGNNGFSGELGHITIDFNGEECRCGNVGCWELYASEKSLIDIAESYGIKSISNEGLSIEHLINLAENGDNKVIHTFEQIGKNLGVGIHNIINIFNPQQIIIGNRMAMAEKWIQNSLYKRIAKAPWFQQKSLKINFSDLSTHSSALGMTAFAIENFMHNDPNENFGGIEFYETQQ